jgi:hypothetical protein
VRLLHSVSTGSDDVGLDLGTYTIFLDLHDPRMLQVPNELFKDEANIVRSSLAEGDTFVDVEANQCSFSVIASRSFRPRPSAQLIGGGGRS